MKLIKRIVLVVLVFLGTLITMFLGYASYLGITYYRIGDTIIDINNNQQSYLNLNQDYSITTFNIGFGAYDRDYSFFMDTGYMEDGTITKGEYSKAITKEHTLSNTNGCIDIIKHLNSDFYTLQEVDTKSTRSYNINQKKMIIESLPNYTNTYSINFHSAYLAYPIYDMHGVANAGILTMSKYNMDYSKRYELPVDDSFIDKFFDLDRCINVSRYKINDSEKYLTIISVHLSAYDEFGVIRKEQMKLLKEIMQDEYNNGNYVIVGGDFNHDLVEGGSNFPTKQLKPDWLQSLTQEEFGNNFNIVCDNTKPSCRNADIPYEEGVTYTTVIDGFIISDNIEMVSIENINSINDEDTNFLYSDHNPVKMHFKLKNKSK